MTQTYHRHIIHAVGGQSHTPDTICALCEKLQGEVLGIKLHPAFIIWMRNRYRFDVIETIKAHRLWVMLDDKSHDIKSEVATFIRMYEDVGADIIAVHASGGPGMLEEAMKATSTVQIFGVTLLTSLEDWEVPCVYMSDAGKTVLRLMQVVEDAGCHGSVCAPHDLQVIYDAGIDVRARVRLCPNIRDPKKPVQNDDQNLSRSLTPFEAGKNGVGLMVIGRMIGNANDPRAAADEIENQFVLGCSS